LQPFEASEVGDVTGRRLVHLQCHIGLDTLSWTRRGAQVSGLDFSAPAIDAASALAASLGIPEFLHEYDFDAFGRFDSLQRRKDGTYRFPPGGPGADAVLAAGGGEHGLKRSGGGFAGRGSASAGGRRYATG
jgi:hypothetical protein